MAALGVLAIGIGGWLCYEAYKGATVSTLTQLVRGKAQAATGTAKVAPPATAAPATAAPATQAQTAATFGQ